MTSDPRALGSGQKPQKIWTCSGKLENKGEGGRGRVKTPHYLTEELLHEGLGPAAVHRPLLGWVADVRSMEQ